jgi:non-hemolytic enterotoxin B/C
MKELIMLTLIAKPATTLGGAQTQNVLSDTTAKMDTSVAQSASQGLIVQGYCMSVLAQPFIAASALPQIKQVEDGINASLKAAQDHAHTYLNVTEPSLVQSLTDMQHYFLLQNALSSAIKPDMDPKTVLTLLDTVRSKASGFQSTAQSSVTQLQTLRTQLSSDSGNISQAAETMNTIVNGDNGVLQNIKSQLSSIDSKIDGAIAGIVIGGLAVIGGSILIAVGALTDIVTAGATTPVIIGGVGLVVVGAGGTAGAAVALAGLLDAKGKLLREQSQLHDEVKLALGLSNGYTRLVAQADQAAKALQDMANAWTLLDNHLDSLVQDIDAGRTTPAALQLYLMAAQGDASNVQTDLSNITTQFANVQNSQNPDQPVGDQIRSAVAA